MNLKGQSSKVFIFAASIIVLGFLIVMSTRFIDSVTSNAEQSAMVSFETKLQDDVNSIRTKTAKRIIEYSVPNTFKTVCILDSRADVDDLVNHPFMQNAILDDTKDNVFIYSFNDNNKFAISRFGVMVYPFFSCIPVDRGRLTLEITGKANKAFVFPQADPTFCQIAQDSTPSTCHLLDGIYSGYSSKCCQLYELCC